MTVTDNRLDGLRGRFVNSGVPNDANQVRNLLVDYFSNAGALEWQREHIGFDA